MKHVLKVTDVSKDFGSVRVLDRVSLEVGEGEVVSIIGPSGAGKTTLLRAIAGLESRQGTVMLHDIPVERPRKEIGMVFQQFNLWPHKTILENIIEAPIVVRKVSREKAEGQAYRLLEKFGLRDKARDYLHTLSGGQQQRVAIIRSLIMEPDVLLLDEVTSALDPEMAREVKQMIRRLANEGRTMIVVTHDLRFAEGISHRVLYLDKGVVVEAGPPASVAAVADARANASVYSRRPQDITPLSPAFLNPLPIKILYISNLQKVVV